MPARSTSISASSAPVPEHNATSQVGYHCSSSRWTSLARVLRQRKAEIKEGQRNVLVQTTLSFSAQPFRVHHARMAAWRRDQHGTQLEVRQETLGRKHGRVQDQHRHSSSNELHQRLLRVLRPRRRPVPQCLDAKDVQPRRLASREAAHHAQPGRPYARRGESHGYHQTQVGPANA